jgi:cobalt/nickel transport protein
MRCAAILIVLTLALPVTALARFGLIVPSDELIGQGASPTIGLRLGVYDPQGLLFQESARPKRFGVQHLGDETDLLPTLKPAGEQNAAVWTAEFTAKSPGDYAFYAEYPPLWVAADEQFAVHLAKVCLGALGREEGWDEPVGLEAEIVPLVRPYGLWTGNLFSGQVLLGGEPAPYAAVEVTWFGTAAETPAALPAPAAAYRVQKLRTDASGIFHYAMPRAGWWGFAAVLDTERVLKHDGAEAPIGLVTSYWVMTRDLKGN